MFYFLSLLMGILISVMVAINGGLTTQYGVYSATVIIHIVGLTLITAVVFIKRERFFPFLPNKYTWFLYLGGAIGVMTTVFNNLAFGRISVSAILALGLFGQSITGIIIDQYGLFGMEKHAFTRNKILGFLLILAGIASMLNNLEVVAVAVSFIAGVNIVLSRTLNAKLADLTSVRVSTFYNYLIGLILSVAVFFVLGRNEVALEVQANWYIYLGGVLGVCVVLLGNIVAVKVSAFYLSLLIFIGQVFTGVLIDMAITGAFSTQNAIGGVLVALGLSVNLIISQTRSQ